MIKLVMLKTHDGAHAGDLVGFEDHAKAKELATGGFAERYNAEKHGSIDDLLKKMAEARAAEAKAKADADAEAKKNGTAVDDDNW